MVRPIRHYCEIRQQTSEIWAGTSPRRPFIVRLPPQLHPSGSRSFAPMRAALDKPPFAA